MKLFYYASRYVKGLNNNKVIKYWRYKLIDSQVLEGSKVFDIGCCASLMILGYLEA